MYQFSFESDRMVIEYLKFRVNPDLRERFVQLDDEIWTPHLSRYSFFLGKEVWISPDDLSQVVMVIRWRTFEEWFAIPAADLAALEARMQAALGDQYEMLESVRYQVRKMVRP